LASNEQTIQYHTTDTERATTLLAILDNTVLSYEVRKKQALKFDTPSKIVKELVDDRRIAEVWCRLAKFPGLRDAKAMQTKQFALHLKSHAGGVSIFHHFAWSIIF